ncbi:MAG: Holliday junction resolvase RecU [Thermacetogeniaceae bacterium]
MVSVQANRGRTFEDLIELAFERTPGAKMFRQANLWIPLRNGGAFPKRGAPVDFLGVIDGIPVAVECKENQSKRISLGPKRFPLKEINALKEFEEAGGKSFVFVAFWQENVIAIYDFQIFYWYWDSGRKSLTSQDTDYILPINKVMKIKKYLGWQITA